MRKIILVLLTFLILMMAAGVAAADTIFMRDGRTIQGTVIGFINGRFAVRLSQATNLTPSRRADVGEIVYIRPRDIDRVEIEGRNIEEARYQTRTVEVSLGPNWIDSGLDVRRGQRIEIKASGIIIAGRTRVTPSGLRTTDPNAPLPRAAEGVLIAAIGNDPNSPVIEVGIGREFIADRDGRLYLTVNRAEYADARGAYNVTIRKEIEFGRQAASNRMSRTEDDADDLDTFGTESSQPAVVRPRTTTSTGQEGGFNQTSPSRVAQEKSLSVPATSRGTDTGIDLRTGDQVTVSATGTITIGRRTGAVSADGARAGLGGLLGTYPLPQASGGALLGYIRLPNGQITQPFVIGSQNTFSAPVDGRLFLLINDDSLGDNTGAFDVKITYTSQRSTPDITITVPGDSQGTDTGIDVRRGSRVMINATGLVVVDDRSPEVSPEGRNDPYSLRRNYPLTDVGAGTLGGYIVMPNGQRTKPFYLGSQQTLTAQVEGRLFLFINDYDYRDNSGAFSVRVVSQ